jgi:DNA repair exonuclease SbcCD ATPase subunit
MPFPLDLTWAISTAGGTIFGAGVIVGAVKYAFKDLTEMKRKQKKLRGEDNGDIPLYMTREECKNKWSSCDKEGKTVKETLDNHEIMLRKLENYARYQLHEAKHTELEIDQILKG